MVFGTVTILSGGAALFGGPSVKAMFGDVVTLVLWFNFASGFAYVLAGLGLLTRKRWSAWLSTAIALSIVSVFLLLWIHIAIGGAYEMRTVGAMAFRAALWMIISWIAIRQFGWLHRNPN